jgi:hypothetical protein
MNCDDEYFKNIKSHNDIKLFLEESELNNFAKEFVSKYKTEMLHNISESEF